MFLLEFHNITQFPIINNMNCQKFIYQSHMGMGGGEVGVLPLPQFLEFL